MLGGGGGGGRSPLLPFWWLVSWGLVVGAWERRSDVFLSKKREPMCIVDSESSSRRRGI